MSIKQALTTVRPRQADGVQKEHSPSPLVSIWLTRGKIELSLQVMVEGRELSPSISAVREPKTQPENEIRNPISTRPPRQKKIDRHNSIIFL